MNEKTLKTLIAAGLWTAGYIACLIVTGHNGALLGVFAAGLGAIFGFEVGKVRGSRNTTEQNVDPKTLLDHQSKN